MVCLLRFACDANGFRGLAQSAFRVVSQFECCNINRMDDDDVKTTEEAIDELTRSISQIDETNWGPWKLDRNARSVYIEGQPVTYSLQIADLKGAFLIGSLQHIWQKTWADNECLGGLVRAAYAIQSANGDPLNS